MYRYVIYATDLSLYLLPVGIYNLQSAAQVMRSVGSQPQNFSQKLLKNAANRLVLSRGPWRLQECTALGHICARCQMGTSRYSGACMHECTVVTQMSTDICCTVHAVRHASSEADCMSMLHNCDLQLPKFVTLTQVLTSDNAWSDRVDTGSACLLTGSTLLCSQASLQAYCALERICHISCGKTVCHCCYLRPCPKVT